MAASSAAPRDSEYSKQRSRNLANHPAKLVSILGTIAPAAGGNSAAGSFGRLFGLAFAGAIMLATFSITLTNMAGASTVLAPQQQRVADVLEDDAELMTNTQLEELLAGQPDAVGLHRSDGSGPRSARDQLRARWTSRAVSGLAFRLALAGPPSRTNSSKLKHDILRASLFAGRGALWGELRRHRQATFRHGRARP
jgi:hypothetical protein